MQPGMARVGTADMANAVLRALDRLVA
jgi:hypothetical protein